jgi:hypothetical protein
MYIGRVLQPAKFSLLVPPNSAFILEETMKLSASFAIFVLLLCFAASPIMAQGAISLDHVDGESEPGQIVAGGTVTFHIRLNNLTSFDLLGSTNGFRFYSPDGGVWSPIIGDTTGINWGEIFDGGLFLTPGSITGSDADTIGFGGFAMVKSGMAAGFNEVVYSISTVIDPSQNGKTFCLDSSYYAPAGYWFWSHSADGNSAPTWDGPHCYVASGCCIGFRGNINNDPGDAMDISDLVYLVDYMFTGGGPPTCWAEANVNGLGVDEELDISDLVYLVDYMFNGGPAPADCF